jgi:putative Mn2+ efflux pump MntP
MSQNMDIYSILLLSVGLAMDAFSVALVAGFGMGNFKLADSLKISGTFGLAHIIMPIAGWFLGSSMLELIQRWDHWIAFLLLAFVGGKMLKEGLDEDADDLDANELLGLGSLLMFTVAVSIDALAVGLSFSVQGLSIWVPSLYMGASTLIFTFVGLNVGNRTGQRFGKRAQVFGGIVLILIGLRIALADMGLLG